MIGRIYRLMDIKRIEMNQREIKFGKDDIIVRPDYLAICAADQRYYFGQRDRKALDEKLPMALIHEATASVMYDPTGALPVGTKVVLIPLIEEDANDRIRGNYNPKNKFASSGVDGFMRDMISISRNRVIPIESEYSMVFVFSELISVVINALDAFERKRVTDVGRIGIWGDGNMGFIVSLVIHCLYPDSEIFIFGKTMRKLQHFSFADKVMMIDRIPEGTTVDHCFECVGGKNSELAIEQMINIISSQGCINLMGVSETPVAVNTRLVLEKGITLLGNSRSNSEDMKKAVKLISENPLCRKYLQMLVSEVVDIYDESDMAHSFEQSTLNDFKTVMKWEV